MTKSMFFSPVFCNEYIYSTKTDRAVPKHYDDWFPLIPRTPDLKDTRMNSDFTSPSHQSCVHLLSTVNIVQLYNTLQNPARLVYFIDKMDIRLYGASVMRFHRYDILQKNGLTEKRSRKRVQNGFFFFFLCGVKSVKWRMFRYGDSPGNFQWEIRNMPLYRRFALFAILWLSR